ncbi:hypothetical protein BLNAU_25266 [Blattamonas nauphoetae]|uniref:Uncharacterized protein n=1 Tax=Blattamonas nauphoetae TaxID=2049346 RepID=A0ABQ9WK35_9EUKA|nr:hypothetical protein BLNAU_25266 [Blattamonas nauphoetae]
MTPHGLPTAPNGPPPKCRGRPKTQPKAGARKRQPPDGSRPVVRETGAGRLNGPQGRVTLLLFSFAFVTDSALQHPPLNPMHVDAKCDEANCDHPSRPEM